MLPCNTDLAKKIKPAEIKMLGIAIKQRIGIGDALQFSSVPENFFRTTGQRLIDVDKPWFFDHNPFVIRDSEQEPAKTIQMWNFSPTQYAWPIPRESRPQVYLSNAEIWANVWGIKKIFLNRPRLYCYEDFPFEKRKKILLHIQGRSHGEMPLHVVSHVVNKYRHTGELYIIGENSLKLDLPQISTATLWDLAKVISESRMLIGMDSGPSWIAACYPDVIVHKLRTKPIPEEFHDWIPMEVRNIHSHWDSREHMIFNPTENDIGFTSSYLKM